MAIKHHTIPAQGTVGAIDQPQWAESHDVDSSGITFNDGTVQTTAAVSPNNVVQMLYVARNVDLTQPINTDIQMAKVGTWTNATPIAFTAAGPCFRCLTNSGITQYPNIGFYAGPGATGNNVVTSVSTSNLSSVGNVTHTSWNGFVFPVPTTMYLRIIIAATGSPPVLTADVFMFGMILD